MSLIDNNNILLREQLGKGSGVVFTTGAQTGKDFYAVHCNSNYNDISYR